MISLVKIFSIVTFTSVFCFGQNSINEIRENYLCAHKQKCIDRLIVISNFNLDNPVINCYNTSAQIMMISNENNPSFEIV